MTDNIFAIPETTSGSAGTVPSEPAQEDAMPGSLQSDQTKMEKVVLINEFLIELDCVMGLFRQGEHREAAGSESKETRKPNVLDTIKDVEIRKLKATLEEKEVTIADLEETARTVEEHVSYILKLQTEGEKKDAALADVQANAAAQVQSFVDSTSKRDQDFLTAIKYKDSIIEARQTDLETARQEATRCEKRLQDFRQNVVRAVQDLTARKAKSEAQGAHVSQKNAQLVQDNKKLHEIVNNYSLLVMDKEADISRLKSAMQDLWDRMDRRYEFDLERDALIEDLKARTTHLNQRIEERDAAIARAKQEIQQLTDLAIEAETQRRQFVEQMQGQIQELNTVHRTIVTDHTAKIKGMAQSNNAVLTNLREARKVAEWQKTQLEQQAEESRKGMAEKDHEIMRLRLSVKQAQDVNAELRAEGKMVSKELEAAKEGWDALDADDVAAAVDGAAVCLGAHECQNERCFCRTTASEQRDSATDCLGADECQDKECFCRTTTTTTTSEQDDEFGNEDWTDFCSESMSNSESDWEDAGDVDRIDHDDHKDEMEPEKTSTEEMASMCASLKARKCVRFAA